MGGSSKNIEKSCREIVSGDLSGNGYTVDVPDSFPDADTRRCEMEIKIYPVVFARFTDNRLAKTARWYTACN
jgi:hypothetical protein